MTFEPVTILCGGNGSGKTTALNVIGEALGLERDTLYNRSSFFDDYIKLCSYRLSKALPAASRVITSDDVFDYVLNLRMMNEGIDMRREEMFEDYLDAKYSDFHFKTMEDYERLKKVNLTRRTTQSRYVRKGLMDNVREHSNGESAFKYFVQKTESEGLYLMDEPGKQPFHSKAERAGRIYKGHSQIFRRAVHNRNSFAFHRIHRRSEGLRYGRDARRRKEVDTDRKYKGVL